MKSASPNEVASLIILCASLHASGVSASLLRSNYFMWVSANASLKGVTYERREIINTIYVSCCINHWAYKSLKKKRESIISNQIGRSGTSIRVMLISSINTLKQGWIFNLAFCYIQTHATVPFRRKIIFGHLFI